MNGILFVLGLVLLNFLSLRFATFFQTLLFLDTLATAIAAFAGPHYLPTLHWIAGPLAGAAVGLLTNIAVGNFFGHTCYLRFAHVNVLCGVLWGLAGLYLPPATAPESSILVYIVLVGIIVGAVSGAAALPMRIAGGYQSDHVVDRVGKQILEKSAGSRWQAAMNLYAPEVMICHFPDKLLATTVGVMWTIGAGDSRFGTYHDLIELAAGYYYIAMGYVVIRLKKSGLNLNADETILFGPLGLFAALLAFPVLFRMLGLVQ